jgi:hypothetical protein
LQHITAQDKEACYTFCPACFQNVKILTEFLQQKLCLMMKPLPICAGTLTNVIKGTIDRTNFHIAYVLSKQKLSGSFFFAKE